LALPAGSRLGPYEVLGLIGAGGMGEVYRARDTRLDRTVALKVLPEDLAADAERRARFEREARTIATLNHPHICTLHDIGEQRGEAYLVMEHLAGETLAERLARGPLPLEQVLDLGAQIAEALGAAHRLGIVHRDLKPANVMLTKGGAKLLDFGLAKLRSQEGVRLVADSSAAATRMREVTAAGTLVGTLPYMAPEQVEGREADARTDVWALGCLLYEMLTGQRAFDGATTGTLVGAILAKEPAPLVASQPVTPPALERLVKRCLAKDPDQRWDSAHDVAYELRWIAQAGEDAAAARVEPRRRRVRRVALVVAGGLVMAALGAGVMWRLRPPAPTASVTHVSLHVGPADELNAGAAGHSGAPGGARTALDWTPDGQALVFVGRRGGVQQLYVRRLDSSEARPLPNTERAQVPAVSADGRSVIFWARRAVKKVPLAGGPVVDLATGIMWPSGLACDDRGAVFVARGPLGIWTIPPGGPPVAVTTVGDGELDHGLPRLLPGGKVLLYTVRKRVWSWGDEEVVARTLATGATKVLLKDAADARYVPTGHLLFLRRGVLFAVPFDADRVEVRGAEVPMLDSVSQALTASATGDLTGAGQFAVAATGTLAWLSSPATTLPELKVVTVDRHGQVAALPPPPRSYGGPLRISPDGRWLAVTIASLTAVGLLVYDLDRGTLAPVVKEGEAGAMAWSPDGSRLAFAWLANGRHALAVAPVDGMTPPVLLAAGNLDPTSWTPDGKQLVAVRDNDDVVSVAVDQANTSVRSVVQTSDAEDTPEFSPDGRWLAYVSNVSGRREVYVRPYPGPGPAEQVSLDGGLSPAWNPAGRELFFVSLPDSAGRMSMMSADFVPGSPPPSGSSRGGPARTERPRIGRPRPLFPAKEELGFASVGTRGYDVARDGQRFYVLQFQVPPPVPPVTHVGLIQNWFEELKAKVPRDPGK
jgi:serine/threonine-protein kinase